MHLGIQEKMCQHMFHDVADQPPTLPLSKRVSCICACAAKRHVLPGNSTTHGSNSSSYPGLGVGRLYRRQYVHGLYGFLKGSGPIKLENYVQTIPCYPETAGARKQIRFHLKPSLVLPGSVVTSAQQPVHNMWVVHHNPYLTK